MLVSVKAVDPARYPFYGKVKLDPPQPLSDVLNPDTVAVSDDLLLRLNVEVGGDGERSAASHSASRPSRAPSRTA